MDMQNTLDISGLRIVNQRNNYRSDSTMVADKKKKEKAGNHILITLMLAVFILAGVGVYASAPLTEYRVTNSRAPREIHDFVEKYPEASSFALNWEKYHKGSKTIDISSQVEKGTYPVFIQWDKRWGYRTYGNGQFLGITGCGPTCLSMVYSGLTGKSDMDPYTMAVFSEENGYYVQGTGTAWSLMSDGAGQLGLKSDKLETKKQLMKALTRGKPVIASVKKGDFTKAGHFILITGLNDDGTLAINDPNSPANSRKDWDIDRVYDQIKAMWSFSK